MHAAIETANFLTIPTILFVLSVLKKKGHPSKKE